SGQKAGEDVHTFFARHKAKYETWTANETSQNRDKRLAREAHASKGGPPGKKGATVFIWEEEDGFLIRRSINRVAAADMWDEYTTNQRVYDSWANQWDLCTALAPEEEAGADDDGHGYVDILHPELQFPEIPDVPRPLLPEEPIGLHSTADDLEAVYNGYSLNDVQSYADFDDGKDYEPYLDSNDVPSCRFGFTTPVAPAQYQEGKSLEDVPRELLDLRQDEADISGTWAVHVERKVLNGQAFYVIRPGPDDDPSLCILLQSAATTLQIVRMGWDSIQGIVHGLFQRGMEFRLCRSGPLRPQPSLPQHHTGLGWRPAGYQPVLLDYLAYQTRRSEFLGSPRGRAAPFAGGIIGRLCLEDINDDRASQGPSDEVLENGVHFWDGQSQTAYWDDALMPQEIDLICGVYVLPTGLPGN
ncbi:hypothetical protein B0H13DRAFT_1631208, partial [Mycena leptocephala]